MQSLGVAQSLIWALLAVGPTSVTLYVDDDAPPGGDGADWSHAFTHLQDALAAADALVVPVEIRIAQGTHAPDRDEAGNVTPLDRDAAFVLYDQYTLKGGFAGIGAADPDERDIATYPSLLTGDLIGDDDTVGVDDNSRHIVRVSGTATIVLDGLTITAGNTDPEALPAGGAAVLFTDPGDLIVRDCTISRCTSVEGAVRRLYLAVNSFERCTFSENVASDGPGAMTGSAASGSLTLEECVFENNVGTFTGAVGSFGPLTVEGSVFSGNQATVSSSGSSAGALFHSGNGEVVIRDSTFFDNQGPAAGAIRIRNTASLEVADCTFVANNGGIRAALVVESVDGPGDEVRVTDCLFLDNTSGLFGGGAYFVYVTHATVERCTFDGNSAQQGGAILFVHSVGKTIDSSFLANEAADSRCSEREVFPCRGGAIAVQEESDVDIDRCRFFGNSTTNEGGAIGVVEPASADVRNSLLTGNVALVRGGAISENEDPTLHVVGCTIVGNSSPNGEAGGIYQEDGVELLRQCILWGNSDASGVTSGAQCSLPQNTSYCCVEAYQGSSLLVVSADPMFLDIDGPDDVVGTLDDDPHIDVASPCCDRGSLSYVPPAGETDLDGEPREIFCAADIGADEVTEAGLDCNANDLPDLCDMAEGISTDCNGNETPDECDQASGFSEDCNNNGILDECDGDEAVYVLDDGGGRFTIPVPAYDIIWLNAFEVSSGNEWIGAVQTSWGFFGLEGMPVTLLLYADPDDDGNPDDAELLVQMPVMTEPTQNDDLATIPIDPTYVGAAGEWFFVGFYASGRVQNDVYVMCDDDDPYMARSWYTYAPENAANIEDLSANHIPPTLIGDIASEVDFMVRAVISNQCICLEDVDDDGEVGFADLIGTLMHWGPCEPPCPWDINGNGDVGFADLTALLVAWGPCT